MLGKRRGFVLLVGLLVLLTLLVQADLRAQTLAEKVKEFELKNGMKFLVVERHEAPVVFCAIAFNVGSANEWPNVTGISHLLEHMMFKGTKMVGTTNYKKEIPYLKKTDELGEKTIQLRKEIGEWRFKIFKDLARDVAAQFSEEERKKADTSKYEYSVLLVEKIRSMDNLPDSIASIPDLVEEDGVNYLDKYLEYEAAWGEIHRLLDEEREYMVKDELWETYMNNGARFLNAGTANDFTVYFVYLPSNRLELWMDLESDRMDSPIFREFWSERDVVMEERRLGENDPDDMLSEAFYAVAFSASPYKWPVVGWMSVLQNITRKELEAYHKRFYAPNNATAVVVGDIDFEKVKKMAKHYFEPIPAQTPPEPVIATEPEQKGERRVVIEHSSNPKIMIGFHKPTYPHPDAVKFVVLEEVLGGGRTSRLYKSVYEEKKLTASAPRVYNGPGERYDNLMIIEAEPQYPHTPEEVEAAIYEELEKIKTEPVSDRELQRIKNQIDAQQIRQLGSNLGIAFNLAMGELYFGDYRGMLKMIEKVKEVTAEDVMDIAKKYLVKKNRIVAVRVKKEEEKKEGQEVAGEEEFNPEDVDQQALMQFIQSLPQDERNGIVRKFQSMKSESEAKRFLKELMERARAAGYDIIKKKK